MMKINVQIEVPDGELCGGCEKLGSDKVSYLNGCLSFPYCKQHEERLGKTKLNGWDKVLKCPECLAAKAPDDRAIWNELLEAAKDIACWKPIFCGAPQECDWVRLLQAIAKVEKIKCAKR